MSAQDAHGRDVLPRARKVRALLAVLALRAPEPVAREQLTALLWSRRNEPQARASLRQALHELQDALGPAARQIVVASRSNIALRSQALWVDVVAWRQSGAADLVGEQNGLFDELRGIDPALDIWLEAERRSIAHPATSEPPASSVIELADPVPTRLVSLPPREVFAPAAPARLTGVAAAPTREARARLGVMPFREVSAGRVSGLALGLAEEITTALAPFRTMCCISSSSLAAIAGEAYDTGAAGRALDLDFLLEGTIREAGGRVRILARLLDMRAGGEVVWARRFDRSGADLWALQEEIASETAAQVDPELLMHLGERAAANPHGNPNAHELVLRAIPAIYRLDPVGFRAAGEMLEKAVLLDPQHASAHAWLAHWHLFLVGQGWTDDFTGASTRAGLLAERALTLDPFDARALTLAGHVRSFLHRQPAEGQRLHDRALAANPNLALAWCLSGLNQCYLGDHLECIRRNEHAQRLSPHHPHSFFFEMALIMPRLLRRDYEAAATTGRRAIELNPGFSSSYKLCLAALGHLGQTAEAAALRQRLLAIEPGFSIEAAVRRAPLVRAADLTHYAEGLKRAGLPERAPAERSPKDQLADMEGSGVVLLHAHRPGPSARRAAG